jgi:hypothetical protein
MKTTDMGIVNIQLRRGNNKAETLLFFDVAVDNSQPNPPRVSNPWRVSAH